jgi:hypothetical protein
MEARVRTFAMLATMMLCGNVLAQDIDMTERPPATVPIHGGHGEHGAAGQHASQTNTPVLPMDARWAGATTLIILGSFLLAAGVGIVVYQEAPALTHDADGDSHDEHHGHDDHGHGAGGGHH